VSVVDRDEPVASRSEWHGDGTAGEDDRGFGLVETAPARPMGEARPGRHHPSLARPEGARGSSRTHLRSFRLAEAISLDALDSGAAACSNPEAVGGELHVADDMAVWQSVAAVQTERVLRLVREVFGYDVLGAYEHGSAVLGGVQPTSDVDILVITKRPASLLEKRQLVEGLMTISARWPPPGPERCVEVTVVAQPQVRPWRYPPSFDLQYGEWLRKRFENGDDSALQATVNPDLTTLLTIVLLGDQPLFGPPPSELLDPVLTDDCVEAMVSDIDVFMNGFEGDTRNLLLTLARIWQTVVTGIIDRKDRAAMWVQERLPSDYQQLMERARAMYLGLQPDEWTGWPSEARACADYMISQIQREVTRRQPGLVLRLATG
jgi:predicted nucleotidyltransferase